MAKQLVYVDSEINAWIEKTFQGITDELRHRIYNYVELYWDHTGSFNYACNRAKEAFK